MFELWPSLRFPIAPAPRSATLEGMKNLIRPLLAIGLTLGLATQVHADPEVTLKVGDRAPALNIQEWVKGDAVRSLQKDQAYLIEFWATW